MKEINNRSIIKTGDWILIRKPPYPKEDKRHSLILVNGDFANVFAFDYKGIMKKILISKSALKDTVNFYPEEYGRYLLNERERKKFNREIILGSLE